MTQRVFLLLAAGYSAHAIDNGLGRTPPMGWRSWNLFGADVTQSLLEAIMDGMVSKKRSVDGIPTSLCDLGYCDVGLDDNWQDCKGGNKHKYHDDSGKPLVNVTRFPNITAMTDHAHKLGLTAGWYANNCICREHTATDEMYQGDAEALVAFGFDGVKLDNCGKQLDLDKWANLLNKTGKPVMIQNCHWGRTVPTKDWCPFNVFRTSVDVRASYGSVVGNLQTTIQWAERNLSRPGCWAYPDSLEVGCKHGPGGGSDTGLSYLEARSHFAAWAIVSAPLVLSMDVNNDAIMDEVWDIVANKEILAVNQAWAGHSGSPFKHFGFHIELDDFRMLLDGFLVPHFGWIYQWQYFYKPVGDGKIAVLLMNHDSETHNLVLRFREVPGMTCRRCKVRCLYTHNDLGEHQDYLTAEAVPSHDSRMFMLTPGAEAVYV